MIYSHPRNPTPVPELCDYCNEPCRKHITISYVLPREDFKRTVVACSVECSNELHFDLCEEAYS